MTFTNIAKSSQGAKLIGDLPLVYSLFFIHFALSPDTECIILHSISLIDHNAWATSNQGWFKGQLGIRDDSFSFFVFYFLWKPLPFILRCFNNPANYTSCNNYSCVLTQALIKVKDSTQQKNESTGKQESSQRYPSKTSNILSYSQRTWFISVCEPSIYAWNVLVSGKLQSHLRGGPLYPSEVEDLHVRGLYSVSSPLWPEILKIWFWEDQTVSRKT